MIAVCGASGNLGGRTLRHLLDRVDADRVLALSRTPGRVTAPVAARAADFGDPAGLVRAFEGVERLLLISVDAVTGRVPLHANAVEAAAQAGVEHVVYTSTVRAGDPGNPSGVAHDHRETERLLAGSGLRFTSLRFNVWPEMLTYLGVAQRVVASGELPSNSGAGGVGYIGRDDSAAVAAAVLAEGGSEGQFLEVTGPAAVTDAELADVLADATGRPVRHRPATDAEMPSLLIAQGMPAPLAEAWTGAGIVRRNGWFDVVTHAAERLTGRRPASLSDLLVQDRPALLAPAGSGSR
ncbi:NAD(P)H-binding protein [Actinomadura barringtoniae]|uniref:NAD(P)H-binding protein n=1 Tax=Actinomadura barringtoniae TaxID=1427535 RepID=A0A939PHQ8_9ACTN|nr:NAD(P)H-binding protein [Actinomadura barringtoniae]MBO2449404.1 NAD(P)H-binding protein [Actinomadura barringtoniae]